MWRDEYVAEKLKQFDADRPSRHSARPKTKRPLRPLARFTGRALRRVGESLELWATPGAHLEQRWESERQWQQR